MLNPQLIRELKGRCKPRNLGLVGGVSIVSQGLLWGMLSSEKPGSYEPRLGSAYCSMQDVYLEYQQQQRQLSDQLYGTPAPDALTRVQLEDQINELYKLMDAKCPDPAINWQLWWHDYWTDAFLWIGMIGLFALLVAGTYMLISDLATEQRRGTLNFLRLSPQPYEQFFMGKLLGVPILVYLGVVLAIPLHLLSGVSAEIPLGEILSFYALVAGSAVFFYSAALLFGLVTTWLGGFQAFLGSGGVFVALAVMGSKPIEQNGFDWLNIFSPSILLRYLINLTGSDYLDGPIGSGHGQIQSLEWFGLPIGSAGIWLSLFVLMHYGLWIFWTWQGLKRNFNNPNQTVLSKAQSYGIVFCYSLLSLGFTAQEFRANEEYAIALVWNLLLFSGLIALLSPQRQTLQDWARYQQHHRSWGSRIRDLVWGDRSPAGLAILINLGIFAILFITTMLLVGDSREYPDLLFSLTLNLSFLWLCASLVQLMMMMKYRKRSLWAMAGFSGVVVLPMLALILLSAEPTKHSTAFLFSAVSFAGVEHATFNAIAIALLSQCLVAVLLNFRLNRLLRQAGRSELKVLTAGK